MLILPQQLVRWICEGFKQRNEQDTLEQAVYGMDALDELGLHPLIHTALRNVGLGVHPEQRYPSDDAHKRRSQGKRCDLVLTEDGRPLRDMQLSGTLFGEAVDAATPDQAYWLEVKTVAQYTTHGPFTRYAAELLSPVMKDIAKLASDPQIQHAGLLVVLFTEDEAVALHDLQVWRTHCLDKGHMLDEPSHEGFPIIDRLGNAWCHVALFPIPTAS